MLVMMLLLVSSQAPTPCGGKFNPCYVRVEEPPVNAGVISGTVTINDDAFIRVHDSFTASTPAPQPDPMLHECVVALEREQKATEGFFRWAATATVLLIALFIAYLMQLNPFAAWKKAELSLPLNIRRLAYVFVTPVVTGALGGVLLRTGEWFATAKAPNALALIVVGAFTFGGVLLGFLTATELKEFPHTS